MFSFLTTFLRLVLALVLGWSALGKVVRRGALDQFGNTLGRGLRLPRARAVAAAWVSLEAATAVALTIPATLEFATVLAALEFGGLTAGAAVLAGQRQPFSCNCFGAAHGDINWRTVARNAGLTAVAAALALSAALPAGRSLPPVTISTALAGYAAIAASVALLVALSAHHPRAAVLPAGRPVRLPASGPPLGSAAAPLSLLSATGTPLPIVELTGRPHLLAFVSSGCQGCRASLPALAEYAARFGAQSLEPVGAQSLEPVGARPMGAEPVPVIVVIVGDARRGADIAQALRPVAEIAYEPDGGNAVLAYGVSLFPSYVVVSEAGTVLATAQSVRDLPEARRQPQP